VLSAVLRATALAEQRPLTLAEMDAPRPGPGQVAIEVEACGVCRTDLHIVEGEVEARLPVVPGHQVAGRVVEMGDGVDTLRAGDLVGVGWLHSTCGACAYCTSGRENLCPNARFTGRDVDGGYAERMVADARFAYPLPAGFAALDAAPLLCAGIIGYRSLRLSGIEPGGRLGLIGFGASAHLAAQVALHWGCTVYAFTREEHHRRLALELGAAWAGGAGDDPGVPLDAAVVFAPAGELVPQALARLDRGATVSVNAIHMSPIPSFEYELLYWERSVCSVANYTRRDAEEFLALAAEIPVRASVERYGLAQANEAVLRIKQGAVHGAAVIDLSLR
jgi:alcohol dehydrogenase, propanol-preferring